MDSSISPSPGILQPRYRHVLSFGDVLDESIRVFRQHWVNFALVSAIALIPPGILLVWVTAAGVFTSLDTLTALQSGRFPNPAVFAGFGFAILASTLVSVLFGLLWSAATVATANAYLHGEVPTLRSVYGQAARRLFVVLVATLVLVLALFVLTVLAGVLSVITVGGLVGIVPLVALIVWWLRPGARKGWVKWLIIVTTPFGLAAYFSFRWSMYLVAIVLEDGGPIRCAPAQQPAHRSSLVPGRLRPARCWTHRRGPALPTHAVGQCSALDHQHDARPDRAWPGGVGYQRRCGRPGSDSLRQRRLRRKATPRFSSTPGTDARHLTWLER